MFAAALNVLTSDKVDNEQIIYAHTKLKLNNCYLDLDLRMNRMLMR